MEDCREKMNAIRDDYHALSRRVDSMQTELTATTSMVDQLDGDWNNHGAAGWKTRLIGFFAKYDDREDRREKAWRNFRWIVTTLIAIGVLLITALELHRSIASGIIQVPKFFHSQTANKPIMAKRQPPPEQADTPIDGRPYEFDTR